MSVPSAIWLFTRPLRWSAVVAWCLCWCLWFSVTLANEGRVRAECEQAGGGSAECLRQEREGWPSAVTVAFEGAVPLAALGGAYVLMKWRKTRRRATA